MYAATRTAAPPEDPPSYAAMSGLPPVATSLQRRNSFVSGDKPAAPPAGSSILASAYEKGLPIHFSGSSERRSKKERGLLCVLLICFVVVCFAGGKILGMRSTHRRMEAQVAEHAEGWQRTYVSLLDTHGELASKTAAVSDLEQKLKRHSGELSEAQEQAAAYLTALQGSEQTLSALLSERIQLQSQMRTFQRAAEEAERRAAEEKAEKLRHGGHGGGLSVHALTQELAAVHEDAERLREGLGRCFRDYSAAVEALQALQTADHAHIAAEEQRAHGRVLLL